MVLWWVDHLSLMCWNLTEHFLMSRSFERFPPPGPEPPFFRFFFSSVAVTPPVPPAFPPAF